MSIVASAAEQSWDRLRNFLRAWERADPASHSLSDW